MTFYDFYTLYAAELWAATAATALLLLLWVALLQRRLGQMHARYRSAMAGREGLDLETLLSEQATMVAANASEVAALRAALTTTQATVRTQVGRIGVVRYNPFSDTGGDQSFAVAWVNAAGDGVVISGLYSRDGSRVYAKPLSANESRYQLTVEERRAIALAHETEAT